MSVEEHSVVSPEEKLWTIGGRQYVQTELTIYGEVRIAQLLGTAVSTLIEQGFPVEKVTELVDQNDDVNPRVAMELATQALTAVPSFAVDSSLAVFGIYEIDDEGKPNAKYADERSHLKKHLKFADWYDIIAVFVDQNDYRRLTGPFASVVQRAISLGLVQMAQETPATPTLTLNESEESETPDSSSPSTFSPAPVTRPRKKSPAATRSASSTGT